MKLRYVVLVWTLAYIASLVVVLLGHAATGNAAAMIVSLLGLWGSLWVVGVLQQRYGDSEVRSVAASVHTALTVLVIAHIVVALVGPTRQAVLTAVGAVVLGCFVVITTIISQEPSSYK